MTRRLVVAGAIRDATHLLVAQRRGPVAVAGLWELPGGKCEPGEDDSQALCRELMEELGIVVEVGDRIPGSVQLAGGMTLVARWARLVEGEPVAHEHSALRWVSADQLEAMAAAGEVVPADTIWVAELVRVLRSAQS